jgi:hypothetical protein
VLAELADLPIVFIASRRRSPSVSLSASAPGLRARNACLKAAISSAASFLNSLESGSPDSICAESTSSVRWRVVHAPSTTLLRSGRLPGTNCRAPSAFSNSRPAIQSNTSLDTAVFGHTTISTGGGSPRWARSCS